jgi:hypothetical protein
MNDRDQSRGTLRDDSEANPLHSQDRTVRKRGRTLLRPFPLDVASSDELAVEYS